MGSSDSGGASFGGCFLASSGFLKEEQAGLVAAAVVELAIPVSRLRSHFFHNGPSFHFRLTRQGQAESYSGRAAILSQERLGTFLAPSHQRHVSSWTYRSALPPAGFQRSGRSRTFTGQCGQPFCPGDATSHVDGSPAVTKYPPVKEWIMFPGFQQARELDPPSPPKRDTSRTISTWPLRRRSLPPDPGCVPRDGPSSSEDFRTGLDPPG